MTEVPREVAIPEDALRAAALTPRCVRRLGTTVGTADSLARCRYRGCHRRRRSRCRVRVRAYLDKGFIGLPPEGAAPSSPNKGTLVLSYMGEVTRAWRVAVRSTLHSVSVFADGRLIWRREGVVWPRLPGEPTGYRPFWANAHSSGSSNASPVRASSSCGRGHLERAVRSKPVADQQWHPLGRIGVRIGNRLVRSSGARRTLRTRSHAAFGTGPQRQERILDRLTRTARGSRTGCRLPRGGPDDQGLCAGAVRRLPLVGAGCDRAGGDHAPAARGKVETGCTPRPWDGTRRAATR